MRSFLPDRAKWLALAALGCLACSSRAPADPNGEPDTAEVVERPAMRRLTRAQYDNTVRDLLGISGHPAADFSEDEVVAGFAANTVLPVQGIQLEQYDEGAADLAAETVSTRLAEIAGCTPAGAADT